MLLAAGANPDRVTSDKVQETALIGAADFGFVEIVEMLLRAGCNADIKNKEGKTALQIVSRKEPTDETRLIMEMLQQSFRKKEEL